MFKRYFFTVSALRDKYEGIGIRVTTKIIVARNIIFVVITAIMLLVILYFKYFLK